MVEWISSWLKNIILIVLLASFVDLLLPSSNMQKYAKLVLGLLIILTIISPILDLVTSNVSINHIMNDLEKEINTSKSERELKVLDPKKATSEINQSMIDQVEKQMLSSLNSKLEGKMEYTAQKVMLDAIQNEQGWMINKISVHLVKMYKEKDSMATNSIKPVETVNIKLDESTAANEEDIPSLEKEAIVKIKEIVSDEWGFSTDKIVVTFLE